jgi:trans-2,3-dihydro-3-hydroxyanthranilate isomerase
MFAGEVLNIPEDPATGAASGPLGAFAVKHGLVPRATKVAIVSEQGTKMGRQSFIRIELTYAEPGDIPTRIDIGGSVMPVLSGTLSDFSG